MIIGITKKNFNSFSKTIERLYNILLIFFKTKYYISGSLTIKVIRCLANFFE